MFAPGQVTPAEIEKVYIFLSNFALPRPNLSFTLTPPLQKPELVHRTHRNIQ